MEKYNKLLRNITELIEKGLFSSKDLKKEVEDSLNLKMQIIANKLNLVSREEFEVQKKMLQKLQKDVFLIGFKAETDITKKELVERAKQKLRDSKADMIIANDIGKKYFKDTTYNELVIVDSKTIVTIGRNKKERISKLICKNIEKRI